MKGLFPQYDDSPSQDYGIVWKNALFVFDTNVLLNLYRYQAGTRDELLNVLSQLSGRIWIPHHVALEFQRNRLKVIAEQNKRFAEVRRTIEKARSSLFADLEKLQLQKRHSLINPQALTSGFEKLAGEFLTELDQLQETQQKLSAPDPLKKKIETLFDGRVGTPPSDQSAVDELYKQAEARFKFKIPPGYQDSEKDKDEPDEHIHGGIIYKRKYGDFLVWKQLLEHSKSVNAKSIIFVTDDGKEDWWRKIESDGPKTIGPRPELIEEARASALIETLLMYNPEGFLKYAKEFLKAPVSEETLKEVRDLSTTRSARDIGFREFREMAMRAEQAVLLWLEGRFESVQENRVGFPDFVAEREGKTFGFEVKVVQNPRMIINRVREPIYRAYYELKESGFSEIAIVWIVSSPAEVEELKRMFARMTRDEMPDNLRMIIGVFDDPETGGVGFRPYDDFALNEANLSFQRTAYGGR
ncbi:hypothetical protein C8239_11875 [Paracidovorax avenae]|uniref:PIN domain-containing protein n=1 Tax=Paracidovorax avenae TaxID=80867 RepID=UPI000D165EFB|nr:PIN domain-containing protein [Paracidovorax avenae]AVS85366.1 hypothetical protein C8239_11875 [Paracidovorax avenae]AVS88876.1 hypothetical protein C8238_12055 [Paracidovorax avenae]AVS96214.1 hypothetical protein C8232_08070 [Paracidovorax avenae]AVT03047.1 hypothetical protein C8243_11515 [Paracidovorax avenae]